MLVLKRKGCCPDPAGRITPTLRTALVVALLFLQSCTPGPSRPGVGAAVSWNELTGWQDDSQASAWSALIRSCSKIADRPRWRDVCQAAESVENPTDTGARAFFERYFRPHPLYGPGGRSEGLITGYYEPLLHGSYKPTERYRYPIYGPPPDLLTLDLGSVYPALAGRQLRGRLEGRTVVPYPDRAQLDSDPKDLAGSELLWVDDRVDLFFLQVQGSGRVVLPDGKVIAVGYADNNGRPYRSIGKCLIKAGAMSREDVNLFSIRQWLEEHPDKAPGLLRCDPRYVFFRLRPNAPNSPEGALGAALTPGRSLAVDARKIALGAPVWMQTYMPGDSGTPLNRLMIAQDTGGAITGYTRADIFWGDGPEAERRAGLMKQKGRMFLLLPTR